jgi:hypothetical protein
MTARAECALMQPLDRGRVARRFGDDGERNIVDYVVGRFIHNAAA